MPAHEQGSPCHDACPGAARDVPDRPRRRGRGDRRRRRVRARRDRRARRGRAGGLLGRDGRGDAARARGRRRGAARRRPVRGRGIPARVAAWDGPQGAKMALDGAAARLARPARRPAGVAAARHRPDDAADLVHDRHRHRSRGRRTGRAARPATRCSRSRSAGRATSSGCAPSAPRPRARLRIDGNEGWDLDTARALTPELIELGVEFVEQPFPAADLDSFRAYRELSPRLPVLIDEGCKDLASVAPIAAYADGIVIKLSKCGGIREALRMIHAARALGLQVMLGCMIESELGIAQAAQLGSLADHIDLDGHLLDLVAAVHRAGPGGRAAGAVGRPRARRGAGRWLTGSRCSPAARFADSHAKTAHGILRYGPREVVARGRRSARPAGSRTTSSRTCGGRCRSWPASPTRVALGANVLVIGVAPFGGALTDEWRAALLEAIGAGMDVEAGLHTVLAEDPELAAAAARRRRAAARPARGAAGPERAGRRAAGRARGAHGRLRLRDREDVGDAGARRRRAGARAASRRSWPRARPGSRSPAGGSRSTT